MKGTIPQAKPLLEVLRTARAFLDDIPMQASAAGLSIAGMDPAKIIMLQAEMDAAEFDDWHTDGKEHPGTGKDNLKILDRIKADSQMSIETRNNVLIITAQTKGKTAEYNAPLWDITKEETKGIKLPPGAEFTIHTKALKDILGKMAVAGEHFTVIARPGDDKLYFTNQIGPRKADHRVETKVDREHTIGEGKKAQPVLAGIEVKAGAMTTYLIAEVEKFLEYASDYVQATFATNEPLKLVKKPSDLTTITLYLAPHIEEIRATEETGTEQKEIEEEEEE